MFAIQSREAGYNIEIFDTLREAVDARNEYEDLDLEDGIYEDNFYVIVNL